MVQRAAALTLLLAGTIAGQAADPAAPGRRIEGCVVDLGDAPVPNASVWIEAADNVVARTRTDASGFFVLGDLPERESWWLLATAEGRMLARTIWRRGDPPEWIRLHDAAPVRGVLRDGAGKPVARASIRAVHSSRALGLNESVATTDEEGRFLVENVPLGFVDLETVVLDRGFARASVLVQPAAAEHALTLHELATTSLTIAVQGLPGGRLEDVSINVSAYAGETRLRLPLRTGRKLLDAEGRCALAPLPDLHYLVRLSGRGLTFEPTEIRVSPGKGPHALQFAGRLLSATETSWPAVVRDSRGSPMAGARLTMHTHANWAAASEAVSDANGTLRFVPPAARGAAVIVRSLDDAWVLHQQKSEGQQGWRHVRDRHWHECDVEPSTPLALCLAPACSVTGRVLRATGEPAAYVEVHVEHEKPDRLPRWMSFASTTTDRDGAYRLAGLPHVADPVRIAVASRAGAGTSEAFEFAAAGIKVAAAELRLTPAAILEGRVLTADGEPLPGARVWLRDWDFEANVQKSGSLVEVITDRAGRYRFTGVPPGGAWLQVLVHELTSTRRAVEPFEVEPGKTRRFDLRTPKD